MNETQFLAVYADSEVDTVITVLINTDNSDLARELFNEYLSMNGFDFWDGSVRIRPIDKLEVL